MHTHSWLFVSTRAMGVRIRAAATPGVRNRESPAPDRVGRSQSSNARLCERRPLPQGVAMHRSLTHPASRTAGGFFDRRSTLAAVALAIALPLMPFADMPVAAAATRTSFTVGATVTARAALTAESVPPALDVSARDVERGFVEVSSVIRLVVTNTSPDGFALDLFPVSPMFSAVTVRGNGAVAAFDGAGGEIFERGLHGAAVPVLLNFRFELAPGTLPGRYPWPLQFSVRPLAGVD
jgi:hypothetical protein